MASTHWLCCCGRVIEADCVSTNTLDGFCSCCVRENSTVDVNLRWTSEDFDQHGGLIRSGVFVATGTLALSPFIDYEGTLSVVLNGWEDSSKSNIPDRCGVVRWTDVLQEYDMVLDVCQSPHRNTRGGMIDTNTGDPIKEFWQMWLEEFNLSYPCGGSIYQAEFPSDEICSGNTCPHDARFDGPFDLVSDGWFVPQQQNNTAGDGWYDLLEVNCNRMRAIGGRDLHFGRDYIASKVRFDFLMERSENDCCQVPQPAPNLLAPIECIVGVNTDRPNGSGACCPITQFPGMELEIRFVEACDIRSGANLSHCYNFPGDGGGADDISDGSWEMQGTHHWGDWQTSFTGTSGHYMAQVTAPNGVIAQFTRRLAGFMQWVDFNDNATDLEPAGANATYDGSCASVARGLVRSGYIDMSMTFMSDVVHILITATVDAGFGSDGFDDLIYEAFIDYDPNNCTIPTERFGSRGDVDFMLRTRTINTIANTGDSTCLRQTVQNTQLRIAWKGEARVYARP